ncbi:hypothetical protein BGX23_011723 [Mortierella sp. AD031]|nr:hypothetical protein BGX23_011723 [Mortierella sp. AD031]
MASILRPAYAFYNRQYQARPILTICVTNAFLAGISDTLTQKYLSPTTTNPTSTTTTTTTTAATATAEAVARVPHKISETVDNAKDKAQDDASELIHPVDQAIHNNNNSNIDSTTSATHENIKEKGGEYIHQGKELAHHSKQQVQDQLSQSGLVAAHEQGPTQDFARTGRFMFYNFSVAPLIHTWYTVLDKNFPIVAQAGNNKHSQQTASRIIQTMKPALKRVAADQILFAPIGLAMLFTGLTVLEGGSLQQIKDKLNNASHHWTFVSTLQANYLVWPMVQLVNFRYCKMDTQAMHRKMTTSRYKVC